MKNDSSWVDSARDLVKASQAAEARNHQKVYLDIQTKELLAKPPKDWRRQHPQYSTTRVEDGNLCKEIVFTCKNSGHSFRYIRGKK
jgi:hypothetical protein